MPRRRRTENIMEQKNIYVTMPTLAPQAEVDELLKQVWESGIMTHNGPLAVSYTHLTLPRYSLCRSRWSPYH